MLRNDREGLYHSIQTIANEPGMVKVRILDQEGESATPPIPPKSATFSTRRPRPATAATISRSRWRG
jgi:hypothetical protein